LQDIIVTKILYLSPSLTAVEAFPPSMVVSAPLPSPAVIPGDQQRQQPAAALSPEQAANTNTPTEPVKAKVVSVMFTARASRPTSARSHFGDRVRLVFKPFEAYWLKATAARILCSVRGWITIRFISMATRGGWIVENTCSLVKLTFLETVSPISSPNFPSSLVFGSC
jgi:hypothetical protein